MASSLRSFCHGKQLFVLWRLPLTSQFTLLHDRVSRVGLESDGVLDPEDVDLGVAGRLADQDGVAALLHDLHRGVLDDLREAGRQVLFCKGK